MKELQLLGDKIISIDEDGTVEPFGKEEKEETIIPPTLDIVKFLNNNSIISKKYTEDKEDKLMKKLRDKKKMLEVTIAAILFLGTIGYMRVDWFTFSDRFTCIIYGCIIATIVTYLNQKRLTIIEKMKVRKLQMRTRH